MFKKLLNFINQQTIFGEIMRFVVVGGIATVIDFATMALVLFVFAPSNYPTFWSIFTGGTDKASPVAALVGTGTGFLFGLAANYALSVLFVFNEKGKAKTATGFLKFAVLSFGGLLLHEAGMFLLFTKLGVNEWLVKILMTLIVLVYNYLTRKFFIFKKENKGEEQ